MSTSTIAAPARPTMEFDLYDRRAVEDPWPLLTRLRDHAPVIWNERTGQWFVTRDKLCRQLLNQSSQFSVENSMNAEFFGSEAFIAIDDKQRHNALRGILTVAFRRDMIENLRQMIARITDGLLDKIEPRLRDGETVDVMAGLCRVLPTYVVAAMLGVHDDMLQSIGDWSDAMADALMCEKVGDYASSPIWLAGEAAKRELADFLREQIVYRRAHPGDDLISQIVHSDVGKSLSDEAIVTNSRQLLFAGNETTAKWLGQIFITFAEYEEDRRAVREDRALLAGALEEVMRWQPVVHALVRNIGDEPVEVEGAILDPGEPVMLLVGAAGRDPERHPNPDLFDIRREQNGHLGFGYGLHNCLGITLARLEAHAAYGRVLDRMPNYELVERPSFSGFSLRGPTRVMVALEE